MTIATKEKGSRKRLTGDKYFNLIEHAADGIAIIQDGVFKLVNTALCRIAGYDKGELVGMSFTELLSPQSQKLTMARYQDRLAGKKVPPVYEIQAVTKDGEIRDIEVNAALTEYEGRVADEVIVRDITERKQVEEALRESEEEKNTIIEEAPVGICHTDLKGTIKYVNKRFEEESGYSREEIIGKNAFKLDWFSKGTLRYFMQRRAARLGGKPHKYWETQFKRKDGTWIWVTTEGKAIKKFGVPVGFQILASNITERKQAEEEIARLAKFPDENPNPVMRVAQDGTVLYANKAALPLLNEWKCQVGQLLPEYWRKFISGVLHSGSKKDVEIDVGQQTISATFSPIAGRDYVNLYGLDITERKQAEETLKLQKAYFQQLFDNSPEAIVLLDNKNRIVSTNKGFETLYGYTMEEVKGKAIAEVVVPEDRVEEASALGKAILNNETKSKETVRKRKDGSLVDVALLAYPIQLGNKAVGGYVIYRDITERKQAEEALRESQEFSSSLLENSPNPILVTNPDTSVRYVNPAFEKLSGFTLAETTGRKAPYPWWPEEQREEITANFKDAMVSGGRRSEHIFQKKNGERFWAAVNSAPVVHDGEPIYFILNWLDITERKQAEEALADEATRRRILVDQSRDGIVVLDENGKVYEANQQFADMLGYTPEEALKLHVWDWEYLFPRERVLEMIRTVDEAGDHFETQHRRKDGSVYDVEISTNGAVYAGQKLIFCVCRDITERKRAEEALQESEEKYKTLVEDAPLGIYFNDFKGTFLYGNKKAEEITGYKRQELLSKSFLKLKLLDSQEMGKAVKLLALNKLGKATGPDRFVLNRKDGTKSIVEIRTRITTVGGKKVVLGMVEDITERKKAEEALQAEKNKLQSVIGAMEYDLTIQDKDFNIIYQNEPSRKSSGGDHLGEKCYRAYEGKEKVCHGCPVEKAFKDGKSHTVERKRLSPSGEVTFFENTANPIRDASGNIVSCLEIGRDITGRKQMERQVQEKNEQLDAQNEELRAINEELQATEEELQQSQEKLERMFESVSDGIVVATLDGTILKVNEKAIQMHGFASEDEMLGKNASELIAPADHERIASNIRKALKEGTIRDQEYTLLKADGSEFPGELSTNALKDGWGNLIGHISVARDITERKQMEELFKTVTNSSPVGIYIMQDKKFQVANPQFQKLTGYTEDELLGMDSLALVLDEDKDMVREKAVKMLKGKRSSPYQFRVVNKSGETRWVMETVTSIPYRGRRAILGNYMDITERRQAEEKERRLQQELNLAGRLASIGQLAAGVAHEINNPLTGVIGFSHLLLGRDIPDDMKQDLQVINSEAKRVSKIVENLLVFAHQRKTGREYVDINNIIARVLELRAYEMKVNNIEVETQLAPDLPHTMADAGQLQQVFLNIVLNAEHFMTTAHNRGKLLVKTERIDGNIRSSFTDDGTGISQENLDKIFNPFFTTKEVGSGTGLGLSICHGIIAQHQGRIYAQSKLGQGATFVIELPIVEAPIPPEHTEVTKEESQKPRGAKILVVDDEAAILTFLHRLLTEWGHKVETLNNAKDALEKLKTERYSLILLDIKLPGMSGIELYQHIEEIAPALTRRVIFITGDVMEPATRQFLDKANVPHIIKPLGIEVLKKAINSALNQTQVAAGK